jgi:RNA polymerase sigma-70 factor (ECF subfamily)
VIEVELTSLLEPSLADGTAQVVERDLLDRALAHLEPEARAVLVLRFYLDLPLPRVAEMLGIPTGTAKSRLHRSIGILRSVMLIDELASTGLVEGRSS